jgi:hypothetical protein
LLGDGVFWANPADDTDSDDETEEWNYDEDPDDN